MRINYIQLKNIGPFVGENKFDFTVKQNSNIILVGGQNGAGKTTLLKAIKIGLFGCFAYGFKTENNSYFAEIKNLLNNRATEKEYEIKISFNIIENYENINYMIERYWAFYEDSINEEFIIYKNDIKLNPYQSIEFINKLKSLTSPALINSFIYDGERISSLIEQDKLSQYLRESFNSIFNIDLLGQLNTDLISYLTKINKTDSANPKQYEIAQLINEIAFIKSEITTYELKVITLKKYIEDINLKIKAQKAEFLKLEGLSIEQIDEYKRSIALFEKENDENNRNLRLYYEEVLPYLLVKNEIKAIISKANKELPIRYAEMLAEIEDYLNEDFSVYINKLKRQDTEVLFNLTPKQIEEIKAFLTKIKESHKKTLNTINRKNEGFKMSTLMKQQIANNEAVDKLAVLIKQINAYQDEIVDKTEELKKLLEDKQSRESELSRLINRYEVVNSELRKDKLSDRSYVLGTMAYDICNKYKKIVTNEKLLQVSNLACQIFNETIRKKTYIRRLLIDEKFDLSAIDGRGKVIKLDIFSAGEQQLLVSSLIWAMFKLSGRREMFVFDTPLARLDSENRILFINKIMKTISRQIIILSTDSEFVGKNYDEIKESISKSYLLVYNDEKKCTSVMERYF